MPLNVMLPAICDNRRGSRRRYADARGPRAASVATALRARAASLAARHEASRVPAPRRGMSQPRARPSSRQKGMCTERLALQPSRGRHDRWTPEGGDRGDGSGLLPTASTHSGRSAAFVPPPGRLSASWCSGPRLPCRRGARRTAGAQGCRLQYPITCQPVSGKPLARATRADASLSGACR